MTWEDILKAKVPWDEVGGVNKVYDNLDDAIAAAEFLANDPRGFGSYEVLYANDVDGSDGYTVHDKGHWEKSKTVYTAHRTDVPGRDRFEGM